MTSQAGDELLPRESLEQLMYQLVERMYSKSSNSGILIARTLRMYLLGSVYPMRQVSQSVDIPNMYTSIMSMIISPKQREEPREGSKPELIKRLVEKTPVKAAPFLVGDIETILNADSLHVPYAVGVMIVYPDRPLPSKEDSLVTWYSEDLFLAGDFAGRSSMMLNYFLDYVVATIRSTKRVKVIYFHNLSRFDGILIIKHIIANRPEWGLKPLMRKGEIYQF